MYGSSPRAELAHHTTMGDLCAGTAEAARIDRVLHEGGKPRG